jgi:2-C-methyl-D-erythritol 4-phosphate cytidylyltransferase / 2-C-methyl-D-erythritol 2,4-cyclodiphosphate synthase
MIGRKRLHIVLLAGGSGSRAGGGRGAPPKQFSVTGRGPLFTVSLRAFLELDPQAGFSVAGITMAVPEAWRENAAQGLNEACQGCDKLSWQLVPAGRTRTSSTWNALQSLADGYGEGAEAPAPAPGDLVAIHDAARPFATTGLLARLVAAAAESDGAVPGVPVPDTIVQIATGGARSEDVPESSADAASYLPRKALLAVQTPQVFRWDLLHAAHEAAADRGLEFTDDGGLLASQGHDPIVVPGEEGNWKVTTERDLRRALELLK